MEGKRGAGGVREYLCTLVFDALDEDEGTAGPLLVPPLNALY